MRLDLYPEIPDELRRQAQVVLRHFPNKDEIAWLAVQVERDCRYPLLAPYPQVAYASGENATRLSEDA